jgi:ABC-type phosphate transport system permease subunit
MGGGAMAAAMVILFGWAPRGDGFEHARLEALMLLVMGQVLTVPIGLVTGIVLAVTRPARTPGYVLGGITMVFGILVMAQGWATSNWADERPSGIGDPDGESFLGALAALSGIFTVAIALIIFVLRSVPELSQSPPVRSRSAPPRT